MADISVVATAVLAYAGATTEDGLAGETITAGQTLYRHTDNTWLKADDTSAVKAYCRGVALNGGAVGQPIRIIKAGGLNPGVAVGVGLTYGVTDTAGGIALISERAGGDFVTIIGVATTTSRIEVNIIPSGVAI
jgi:hypothetical protein